MCFSLKIVHIYGNFDINSYEKAQSALEISKLIYNLLKNLLWSSF